MTKPQPIQYPTSVILLFVVKVTQLSDNFHLSVEPFVTLFELDLPLILLFVPFTFQFAVILFCRLFQKQHELLKFTYLSFLLLNLIHQNALLVLILGQHSTDVPNSVRYASFPLVIGIHLVITTFQILFLTKLILI